jgi:hypothetical protein
MAKNEAKRFTVRTVSTPVVAKRFAIFDGRRKSTFQYSKEWVALKASGTYVECGFEVPIASQYIAGDSLFANRAAAEMVAATFNTLHSAGLLSY